MSWPEWQEHLQFLFGTQNPCRQTRENVSFLSTLLGSERDLCLCSTCCSSTTATTTRTVTTTTVTTAAIDEPIQETPATDGPSNVPPRDDTTQQRMTNATIPTATTPHYNFAAPWFPVVPPAPMTWTNPHVLPRLNWNLCCQKCRECCGRFDRRGRPPHDNGCHFKVKNKSSV